MRLVFDSIVKNIETAFPNMYVYTDNSINLTETIPCTILAKEGTGTTPSGDAYIIYRISDGSSIKFKNKDVNLVQRSINLNGYNDVTVIEHTIDTGLGDLIKCIYVADVISDDTDPATTCTVEFKDVIFMNWEYLVLPYQSQLHSFMQGLQILISIKTKNDNTRDRIDEYVFLMLKHIFSNKKMFKIYDSTNNFLGYFSLLINPSVQTTYNEKENIQVKSIVLTGQYNINYNY